MICDGVQAGIDRLPNLQVLLMSNNRVKDWSEIERLSGNAKLEDLLLMGNPLTPATGTPEYRIEADPHALASVLATPLTEQLVICSVDGLAGI